MCIHDLLSFELKVIIHNNDQDEDSDWFNHIVLVDTGVQILQYEWDGYF